MKHNFAKFFAGKGYYIALILCASAIGITGYLYYRNTDPGLDPTAPSGNISVMNPTGDVQRPAIKPTLPGSDIAPGTQPTDGPKKPFKTSAPVEGQTVMDYCMDCLGYNPTTRDWRTHDGMDIAAEAGSAVLAAADGTVYTVYEDETMGTTVVIRHENGYVTTYASLDKTVSVAPGDSVKLGQQIGKVGSTALLESAVAEHVHFSVTKDGKTVDPEDFLKLGQ